MATKRFDPDDPDGWKADLRAAGWVEVALHRWQAPDKSLHIGPFGAWRTMNLWKRQERTSQ